MRSRRTSSTSQSHIEEQPTGQANKNNSEIQLDTVAEVSHDNVDPSQDEEDDLEPLQSLERVLMDETAHDGIQMECDYGGVQIKGETTISTTEPILNIQKCE